MYQGKPHVGPGPVGPAFSLMFLWSGRVYWQELIESILWAHHKLKIVPGCGFAAPLLRVSHPRISRYGDGNRPLIRRNTEIVTRR